MPSRSNLITTWRYPASPLRYPGGKAGLAPFLEDVIDLNDLRGCAYYEPYAGGAGAALTLLRRGAVARVFLNDADERVYAFWTAALNRTLAFVKRIRGVDLSIEEWYRQKEICDAPEDHSPFDVGFAAFYMNRCNRSGVLTGGPIGGYEQEGRWRLDVRFNRDALAERITKLAAFKEKIQITSDDALAFLKGNLPTGGRRRKVLAYLDPPYVKKGSRLYLNAYEAPDHAALARYLRDQGILHWIMSYDNSELIRTLYSDCRVAEIPIRYTLQAKRNARELAIVPNRVSVPRTCRIRSLEGALAFTRGKAA